MHEIVTAGSAPVFTVPFVDLATGELTDPSAASVAVVDAAGDAVPGWTAAIVASSGVKVTGTEVGLGRYVATVSATVDGAAQSQTVVVEAVGARLVNPSTATASDATLARASWAEVQAAITAVEAAVHEYVGFSFVQRRTRFTTGGSGRSTLVLPDMFPTAVVSAEIRDLDGTWTALTVDELADLHLTDAGTVVRRTGVWTAGVGNVRIVYDHGWFSPPADLTPAFIAHVRHFVTRPNRQRASDESPEEQFQIASIPAAIRVAYDDYRRLL